MNEPIYRARREMFNKMDIPISKADVQILKWKQRTRLMLWETMLRSLLVIKRAIDLIVSAVTLILFSPLFLFVSICIIIDDGFPVIFSQKRVGLDGREFLMFKFRTMCREAENLRPELMNQNESSDGVVFKIKKDPRVLKCGRFFRRFRVDEIPELWNVL